MVHELKAWPKGFKEIVQDLKLYELRKNDRDYQVGDELLLREWDPETEEYTGNRCQVKVLYIYVAEDTSWGLLPGYCCMSIQKVWCDPYVEGGTKNVNAV